MTTISFVSHATKSPWSLDEEEKPGRREQNKREKLSRITNAAETLFREHGFDETTGRQICELAEIGTGTLFLYVKDKRELLSLIFEPQAQSVFAKMAIGLGPGEDLADGLVRIFGSFFRLYSKDEAMARLFVQDLFFRGCDSPQLLALQDELQARVAGLVRDAQERRSVRRDVAADHLALTFLAHYVFWLQLWLRPGGLNRRSASKGLRSAIELQVEGVGLGQQVGV